MFNLLTHETRTHPDDLYKYSVTSVLLGRHYVQVRGVNDEETLALISSLILRHLLQSICNAHAITLLRDSTEQSSAPTYDRDQVRIATAIYPRVSLLNHACDPNVISSFEPNTSTIVVKSSRAIEKSAEIYNCYGPHWLKMSLLERKQSLSDQYRFDCQCDACLRQLNATDRHSSLKCVHCSHGAQLSLQSTGLCCESCHQYVAYGDYTSIFDQLNARLNRRGESLDELERAYRRYLFIDERLELTLPERRINECAKLFYLDFTRVIDFKARLKCNAGEFVRASDLLEANIRLLAIVYDLESGSPNGRNEYSIEFANELFKLAEIQCNCGRLEQALVNVNKAISITGKIYSKENKLLVELCQLRDNIKSVINN